MAPEYCALPEDSEDIICPDASCGAQPETGVCKARKFGYPPGWRNNDIVVVLTDREGNLTAGWENTRVTLP